MNGIEIEQNPLIFIDLYIRNTTACQTANCVQKTLYWKQILYQIDQATKRLWFSKIREDSATIGERLPFVSSHVAKPVYLYTQSDDNSVTHTH